MSKSTEKNAFYIFETTSKQSAWRSGLNATGGGGGALCVGGLRFVIVVFPDNNHLIFLVDMWVSTF